MEVARQYDRAVGELGGEDDSVYQALIIDAEGDWKRSFQLLREASTPDALNAALIVLGREKGEEAVFSWLAEEGIKVGQLNEAGATHVLAKKLERGAIDEALADILAWFPALLISNLGATLLTIAVSCGLFYALGSWARTRGKNIESRLLAQWGGWPSTIALRHSGLLQAATIARYHGYLAKNVPHLLLPTPEQERLDPKAADEAYASAVKWLKEKTRKGFPLIEKENAQYGFRRNLLGMRPIGITLCAAATGVSLVTVFSGMPDFSTASAMAIASAKPSELWAAVGVNVAAILWWIFVVNAEWVKQAGDQYADALLAACDVLGAERPRAAPRKAK